MIFFQLRGGNSDAVVAPRRRSLRVAAGVLEKGALLLSEAPARWFDTEKRYSDANPMPIRTSRNTTVQPVTLGLSDVVLSVLLNIPSPLVVSP
jgi:hypothetical protein